MRFISSYFSSLINEIININLDLNQKNIPDSY